MLTGQGLRSGGVGKRVVGHPICAVPAIPAALALPSIIAAIEVDACELLDESIRLSVVRSDHPHIDRRVELVVVLRVLSEATSDALGASPDRLVVGAATVVLVVDELSHGCIISG